MFKRFLIALSVLIATTAGFGAVQAFAWHVSGVEATAVCVGNHQKLTVDVALSDNGPGDFTFKLDGSSVDTGHFGNVDTFHRVVNPLNETAGSHVLRVEIVWATQESNHFQINVDFPECGCPDQIEVSHQHEGDDEECQPPTTTTSVPPTTTTIVTPTTTVPPTTITTPTSTVVVPPTSSPSPPSQLTATPTDTLAFTGAGTVLWILGSLGLALVLIGADVRRRALRNRPAGEGFDAPDRPVWDLRNRGW